MDLNIYATDWFSAVDMVVISIAKCGGSMKTPHVKKGLDSNADLCRLLLLSCAPELCCVYTDLGYKTNVRLWSQHMNIVKPLSSNCYSRCSSCRAMDVMLHSSSPAYNTCNTLERTKCAGRVFLFCFFLRPASHSHAAMCDHVPPRPARSAGSHSQQLIPMISCFSSADEALSWSKAHAWKPPRHTIGFPAP